MLYVIPDFTTGNYGKDSNNCENCTIIAIVFLLRIYFSKFVEDNFDMLF